MTLKTLYDAIDAPRARVFRRAYIKRRSATTGLFEDDWTEITADVKNFGSVRMSIDAERAGKITLDGLTMKVRNDSGRYNPSENQESLWYGYLSQQRTLVKIEAGFYEDTCSAGGIWTRKYFPDSNLWDESQWDQGLWDTSYVVYTGVLAGNINLSSNNDVSLPVRPMSQIFKDFPASALRGLNSSLTASGFIQLLRDQTDGSGNLVFRPFFGNTVDYWDISTTTNVYANLNTTTAKDVRDKNVLDLIEKLAEAEQFYAYTDSRGGFNFISKNVTPTDVFDFVGIGTFNSPYGHTIKAVSAFGKDVSKYYSGVQVRFSEADTSTSFVSTSTALTVGPNNDPWLLGHKILQIENYWIANATVAESIAAQVFADVGNAKDSIEFTTSFVPHVSLLASPRVSMYFDTAAQVAGGSGGQWDMYDWDTSLVWEKTGGDAILLSGDLFKLLSVEINLDNFECRYKAKRA